MRSRTLAAATIALSCACGVAPDHAPALLGTAIEPITNGANDDGDPAVVALVDANGRVTCTGTLISPHVVLTAAHCAIDARTFSQYRAFFGSDVTSVGTFIAISNATLHPGFVAGTFANDVAALALASRAPVTPALTLKQASDAALTGASMRVVGFGETAADAKDFGRKRSGAASVSSVGATSFELLASPSQPCSGDSGGPAFLRVGNVDYIAGITSHGDAACAAHDVDTRTDAYVTSFLEPYVDAANDGAAHAGDACFFPEHCANGAACVVAPDEARIHYCAPSCTNAADCPSTMRCTSLASGDSQCRYPTPTPGAIGSACSGDAKCIAGDQCIDPGTCSHRCNPSVASDCENGFECTNVGDIRFFCTPAPPKPFAITGSSGCTVFAPRGRSIGWLAGAALIAALVVRERRRRRA